MANNSFGERRELREQLADKEQETKSLAELLQATITTLQRVAENQPNSTQFAEVLAKAQADAHRAITRQDNPNFPAISPYNPEGELAAPRAELKCDFFQDGVPVIESTTTREEIELLNLLEPGEFYVDKSNGEQVKVVVLPKVDPSSGEYLSLNVVLGAKKDDLNSKLDWPVFSSVLRQILEQTPQAEAAAAVAPMPKVQRRVRVSHAGSARAVELSDSVTANLPADVRTAVAAMQAATSEAVPV